MCPSFPTWIKYMSRNALRQRGMTYANVCINIQIN